MDPFCDVESFENCFRVKRNQMGNLNGGGGQRKIVKGLSKSSRRRLVFLINSLPPIPEAYFVTLTMREASEDFKIWKAQLNRTLNGIRYHYPKLSGLWRLEFQKRGTPHFHFLIFPQSGSDLREVREKILQYWSSAVGNHNIGYQGVQVERIRDMRKSGFYLAIYSSKDEQDRKDIPTGRLWGIINRKEFPIARYHGSEVQDIYELTWYKRIYRRYIKANGACTSSPLFRSLQSRETGFRGFMSRSTQRKFFAYCRSMSTQTQTRRSYQFSNSYRSNHNGMGLYKKDDKKVA